MGDHCSAPMITAVLLPLAAVYSVQALQKKGCERIWTHRWIGKVNILDDNIIKPY